MWYIKLVLTHYWLNFKLNYLCPEYVPHVVIYSGKRYIEGLYIDEYSLAASRLQQLEIEDIKAEEYKECIDYVSARDIHINTTKDTPEQSLDKIKI